jgi:hypothetical protein
MTTEPEPQVIPEPEVMPEPETEPSHEGPQGTPPEPEPTGDK